MFNANRPPSRHKDPPQNLGLDLPLDDAVPIYVDDDTDSEDAFEIGMDKAVKNSNKKVNNKFDDFDDEILAESNAFKGEKVEICDEFNMHDFLNQSGHKRKI